MLAVLGAEFAIIIRVKVPLLTYDAFVLIQWLLKSVTVIVKERITKPQTALTNKGLLCKRRSLKHKVKFWIREVFGNICSVRVFVDLMV